MSWDHKKRGRSGGYLYESVRVNGRVVKRYIGCGPAADRVAKKLAERRRERLVLATERERYTLALAALNDLDRWLKTLLRSYLLLGGYYAHKGQWRARAGKPRRSPTPPRAA